MSKKIHITVHTDGDVSLEAQGYQGEACLEATRELEEKLGSVEQREKKPSFYEQDRPQTSNRQEENHGRR